MAVRFVLGRSGTGKTRHCIDAVTAALRDGPPKQPLVLLVPEQASFQAERSILAQDDIAGYSRLQVLSFDRLGFLLAGPPQAQRVLSRIGREMIVYSILRKCRDSLSIFARAADTAGLARHMARIILELHQSAKQPQDLQQLLAELAQQPTHTRIGRKFADIAVVFEHYQHFLTCNSGIFVDPDQQLTQVERRVADCSRLKGARLWVDGFAGFTLQEQSLLISLMKICAETEIALCLDPTLIDLGNADPDRLDPNSLFMPTEKTYCDLLEAIRQARLAIQPPLQLQQIRRFDNTSALAWIERSAFDPEMSGVAETIQQQANQQIHILTAPDPRAETQMIAREIHTLVRNGRCRYRDIAVVASDLASYQPYLEAAFADSGIPCFIDRPGSVQQHPMIELVRNAFTAVLGGFETADVIAWLKSPLGPIDAEAVSLLENYCLAFGINRGDWTSAEPWPFTDADIQEDRETVTRWDLEWIHAIRTGALRPLLELRDKLGLTASPQPISADDFVRAVWGLIDGLMIPRKLDELGLSDPQQAMIHRQLFDKLVDLFDEFTDIFVDQPMEPTEQFFILRAAIGQLALKQIPPMIDQVLVGSIERSRHPDLKAVFLIGTTQKQFPIPLVEDPILNEHDRTIAARQRFVLSDRPATQAAARQYLAYIAFTRPSEQLYISYPRMDSSGSEVYPSRFVQMLADRLGLKAGPSGTQDEWASISGPIDLQDRLGRHVSLDDQTRHRFGLKLVRRLAQNPSPDLACLMAPLLAGLDYQNRVTLDAALIRRRWARTLPVSASRLESYGRCPYQFFSRYLLELNKREILRLEPLDLGSLYHRVLERLFYDLRKDKRDLAGASDEILRSRTTALFDDEIQSNPAIANLIRHSRQDRWRISSGGEILCAAVLNMARICRAGVFRPIAAEAGFGPGDKQVRIELTSDDGTPILLCGSIDRIDAARIGGKNVAVVFDYKIRERSINWSHLSGKIDLQLPVYLIAASRMSGVEQVVGAFYLPIELRTPRLAIGANDSSDEDGDKPDNTPQAKAKGVFNGEYAGALDSTNSVHSKCYNFSVSKNDGVYGWYKDSAALRPGDYSAMLGYADKTIREMAQSMVSGRIEVRPYRLGEETPCSHCNYRAVCKFDWQINDYRKIDTVDKSGFLAGLTGGGHG